MNLKEIKNKMESYCFKCKKEKEMLIDTIIIGTKESKYIGECKTCNEYMCRIIKSPIKKGQ